MRKRQTNPSRQVQQTTACNCIPATTQRQNWRPRILIQVPQPGFCRYIPRMPRLRQLPEASVRPRIKTSSVGKNTKKTLGRYLKDVERKEIWIRWILIQRKCEWVFFFTRFDERCSNSEARSGSTIGPEREGGRHSWQLRGPHVTGWRYLLCKITAEKIRLLLLLLLPTPLY